MDRHNINLFNHSYSYNYYDCYYYYYQDNDVVREKVKRAKKK